MKFNVAIIGGGASACLILAHLARSVHHFNIKKLSIKIYESGDEFAVGKAYSTRNIRHLLNVRARDMGGYALDIGDFLQWLSVHYPDYSADDFVPRMIYGQYLKNIGAQSVQTLHDGGHDVTIVKRHVETAQDIETADFIINATGNKRLDRAQNSALDAYNTDYSLAPKWRTAIICGSGLSMIDAVLSLQESGFNGQIICVSRHGFMPLAHAKKPVVKIGLDWFDETRTHKISEIFFQIRRHARQIIQQGGEWQSVVNSLRPVTNRLWQNLQGPQRQKFIARLMPYWNIHRHRIAPHIHAEIMNLRQSGLLSFVQGHVEAITKIESGWHVKTRDTSHDGDIVIDCMGYRVGQAPVVQEQQKLQFDVQMGPVNWPELFETVAIPEIRQQADKVAQRIAELCK